MSLPWKRPTAELLYENLTAILNSFDICALPRVMFAPVLFLFHWKKKEKNNNKNQHFCKKIHETLSGNNWLYRWGEVNCHIRKKAFCFAGRTTESDYSVSERISCGGRHLHVDLPWVFSQFGQWYMSMSGASSSSTPTQLKQEKKYF